MKLAATAHGAPAFTFLFVERGEGGIHEDDDEVHIQYAARPAKLRKLNMTFKNLQEKMASFPSPVAMLRSSQTAGYVHPIQAEFSNWQDEQRAWRETAILFDQSYTMLDLYIEGPDLVRLLTRAGVNSFENFKPGKAKQLVCCNQDGFVIGDAILFYLPNGRANVVGRPAVGNWLQYLVETEKFDVSAERDEPGPPHVRKRKTFRFQLQGPNAWQVLERLHGRPLPNIKFFNLGELTLGGHQVVALRHGMVGAPGLEFFGKAEEHDDLLGAILRAGEDLGLRRSGSRAYPSSVFESGWISSPVPAIYSGDGMRGYREWLPAHSYEANASLGGSFVSTNIEDYYLRPSDLGYGMHVKFDHDFVGRDALEAQEGKPTRKKVTLIWNAEDVGRILTSMLRKGPKPKSLEFPLSYYSILPYDEVKTGERIVGISAYSGYLSTDRTWMSLAMIDEADAATGSEVLVTWGDPDGGGTRPPVEPHVQTQIRATVAPCPHWQVARDEYRHT